LNITHKNYFSSITYFREKPFPEDIMHEVGVKF